MSQRSWKAVCFLVVSSAVTLASVVFALEVPPLTGRVVDLAHVLPADVAASLTRDLEAHETKTSNQVAVLILLSLDGEPLESFAHRVGTTWKLGHKGTDNGVLLLIAVHERKVRIEVGYGLEGTLTDLRSAHIIRQEIVPRLRSGDLPGGIAAGVQAILGTIEGTYKAEEVLSGPALFGQELDVFLWVIIGIGIVVGTLAGIWKRHVHPGGFLTFFIFLSAMFVRRQFGGVELGLGLAAVGVTVFLVWLILGRKAEVFMYHTVGEDSRTSPAGGFGGSSGGDSGGGFSGGGGGFGGGGASGGW